MTQKTIKLNGEDYWLIPIHTTDKKKPNRTAKPSSIKLPKGYSGVVRALADSYRITVKDYIERAIIRKVEGNNPMAIVPIPEKHSDDCCETFSFWLHPAIRKKVYDYLDSNSDYTYTTFIQSALFGWDNVDCIEELCYT